MSTEENIFNRNIRQDYQCANVLSVKLDFYSGTDLEKWRIGIDRTFDDHDHDGDGDGDDDDDINQYSYRIQSSPVTVDCGK